MTLFGPVFQKELLELSRRRSTFYFRALTGAALFIVILIYANADLWQWQHLSLTKRQAAIGELIFTKWMWVQFWVLCGMMPLLVCGLIAAEREAGSLELLFTTHLTNREIILGKLASRLFFAVLLVFSALPVLLIIGLLGGIDFDMLFKLYLVTGSTALLIAAVGVYYSVVSRRPWVACLQTYLLFAFLWAAVPFTMVTVANMFAPGGRGLSAVWDGWFFSLLVEFAPYIGVFMLTGSTPGFLIGFMAWNRVWIYTGVWLGVAVLFLAASFWRLRAGPRPSRRRQPTALGAWIARHSPFKRLRARSNSGNPVFGRSRRREAFDPDGHLFRIQLFAWPAALAMLFLVGTTWRMRGFGLVIALETAFLQLILATVGASALARERQRGSLDLQLLTRLPSAAILLAAAVGVLRTCLPTILLIGATLYAAHWVRPWPSAFLIQYFGLIAAYSLTLLIAAMLMSAAAPRPAQAVAGVILLGVAHWFLPLPVGAGWLLFGRGDTAVNDPTLRYYIAGFATILLVATLAGVRLLARRQPFPAAVVAAVVVPLWLLVFSSPKGRVDDATLLSRWLLDLDGFAPRSGFLPPSIWGDDSATAHAVLRSYLYAAAALAVFAAIFADRLLGRLQARAPQPAPKLPVGNLTPPVDAPSASLRPSTKANVIGART